MKKFFTFMAAALFTATASAQWVVVENFDSENVEERVRLFNVNGTKYNRPPKGDFKIVADQTSSSSDRGNVVEVNCTDQETIVEVDVTLPDGTLSDYSDIAFDLYYTAVSGDNGENQCYKRVYVKADNQDIYVEENYDILANKEITKGNWGEFSTAIPDNNVSNSFSLRLGILGDAKEPLTYYIDNIRLKKKEAPGTSHNGEMVGDWYMLQDFEAATEDDIAAWDKSGFGIPEGTTFKIINNPTADNEKVAWFAGGNTYHTILEVKAELQPGKTLADYSEIAFDLYRNAEEENDYPGLYIRVNDIIINDDGEKGYDYGPETTWTEVTKPLADIDGLEGITGQIKIRLGLLSARPSYLIDNVRLKPTTATGITDVQAGAETVVVVDGGVMINAGAKAAYAVYDISGRAVSQGVADGSKTVTLQRGVYVVRVNGKAVKVLVR